jgi:Predicted membrane protein (DUF2306)
LFAFLQLFNAGIFFIALSYLRIDFDESYLIGKEHLVNQPVFRFSLIIHGLSAPFALLFVSSLVLLRIEKKSIQLHRLIGKSALIIGLFFVVPSGIGLSFYASGGPLGKFIFVCLSFYTAYTIISGFLSIKQKDILLHQHWMNELLVLLSSAITLRVLITFFTLVLDWKGNSMYNTAAFISWIPLILMLKIRQKTSLR